MYRLRFALLVFAVLPLHVLAASGISRRDAFVLIWNSTARPIEATNEAPYEDVEQGSSGEDVITYAKARSILGDVKFFSPDDTVVVRDALKWIFRTRSIEPYGWDHTRIEVSLAEAEDVEPLAQQYGLHVKDFDASLTEEELLALLRYVDAALAAEIHEASLYSEKFHGKGTAFGESFNMYDLTAAHRSFPYNTLVRVTNQRNGKSVLVRINDRGPFVNGRDMDLSLAAFTTIEDRRYGKIQATFERLGDISIVGACHNDRFFRRITRETRFDRGVPHALPLGQDMVLTANAPFVVRSVTYPDGFTARIQDWILDEEKYTFSPSQSGKYVFRIGDAVGHSRLFPMDVVDCSAGN